MTQGRIAIVIAACILTGAGCWYSNPTGIPVFIPGEDRRMPVEAEGSLRSDFSASLRFGRNDGPREAFIDVDRFAVPELGKQATRRLPGEETIACAPFRAGIVNHHALASDLLAGFFRTLNRCRPDIERFVILSPDHNLAASTAAATHRLPYRTVGRDLVMDAEGVSRLLELPFVREQSALFEREHGIGAIVPFLADAYPDAKLVPVVIRSSVIETERRAIASWLASELAAGRTFVIVSADMSHYLDERSAMSNDRRTKAALETRDALFFARANDDLTDNGKSIAIVMEALEEAKWTLLGESISNAYSGSPLFTTTYLVGFWE